MRLLELHRYFRIDARGDTQDGQNGGGDDDLIRRRVTQCEQMMPRHYPATTDVSVGDGGNRHGGFHPMKMNNGVLLGPMHASVSTLLFQYALQCARLEHHRVLYICNKTLMLNHLPLVDHAEQPVEALKRISMKYVENDKMLRLYLANLHLKYNKETPLEQIPRLIIVDSLGFFFGTHQQKQQHQQGADSAHTSKEWDGRQFSSDRSLHHVQTLALLAETCQYLTELIYRQKSLRMDTQSQTAENSNPTSAPSVLEEGKGEEEERDVQDLIPPDTDQVCNYLVSDLSGSAHLFSLYDRRVPLVLEIETPINALDIEPIDDCFRMRCRSVCGSRDRSAVRLLYAKRKDCLEVIDYDLTSADLTRTAHRHQMEHQQQQKQHEQQQR